MNLCSINNAPLRRALILLLVPICFLWGVPVVLWHAVKEYAEGCVGWPEDFMRIWRGREGGER